MDNRVISMDSFLPPLQDKYNLIPIDTKDASKIYLRGSILSKEDAEQFVKDFSKCTKTEWNVAYEIKTPSKSAFHKLWCCQFNYRYKASYRKKTEKTYKNLNCLASINIFVKKITANTVRNDKYLKSCPPLAAIIKIKSDHSHPIDSPDFLQRRRPTEETKAKFYQYFEMGLSIPESRKIHSTLLEEEDIENLEDAAVNPTATQVAYFHKLWKSQKEISCLELHSQTKSTQISFSQSSSLRHADDLNLSESQSSDIDGNFTTGTKAIKRSYRSSEDSDILKKTKTQNEMLNKSLENSEISDEELPEDVYQELHKKFDLMDKECSDTSRSKQKAKINRRNHKLNSKKTEKKSSKNIDSFVTYFMFGPSKGAANVCDVSHARASEAAQTLLTYMESQSDTDLADIVTVRRYLRKIKDKIENSQSVT